MGITSTHLFKISMNKIQFTLYVFSACALSEGARLNNPLALHDTWRIKHDYLTCSLQPQIGRLPRRTFCIGSITLARTKSRYWGRHKSWSTLAFLFHLSMRCNQILGGGAHLRYDAHKLYQCSLSSEDKWNRKKYVPFCSPSGIRISFLVPLHLGHGALVWLWSANPHAWHMAGWSQHIAVCYMYTVTYGE